MKRVWIAVMVCLALGGGHALAQEHFTQGPVWICTAIRTTPGHFDDYLEYLRGDYLKVQQESIKAGLMLDSKVFVKAPADPNDYDVLICDLFPNAAKALDYSAADDAKSDEIAAKVYGTSDENQQEEQTKPRFEMRTILGTTMVREVTLKPLQ
jgi:hypothetical protein